MLRSYRKQEAKQAKEKHCFAYKIRGARTSERRIKVIEEIMSTRVLLDEAQEYHTTLTSVLLRAIYEEMPLRARKSRLLSRCLSICAIIFRRFRHAIFLALFK